MKYINWIDKKIAAFDPPRDRNWLALTAGVPVTPVPLAIEFLRICRLIALESGSSVHVIIDEASKSLDISLSIEGLDGRYLPINKRK
tara:strand:+ start:136 stop:396 length:261 start_codon:yes stop_codon:yes gene_type:complete